MTISSNLHSPASCNSPQHLHTLRHLSVGCPFMLHFWQVIRCQQYRSTCLVDPQWLQAGWDERYTAWSVDDPSLGERADPGLGDRTGHAFGFADSCSEPLLSLDLYDELESSGADDASCCLVNQWTRLSPPYSSSRLGFSRSRSRLRLGCRSLPLLRPSARLIRDSRRRSSRKDFSTSWMAVGWRAIKNFSS